MTEKKYLDYPGLQSYNNALKGVYATKDLATSENNGLMSSTDKNKLNNLNVVEMTQAEYDALSEEEKNDGTIRFIPDGTPSGGGGASSTSIAPIESTTTASKAYAVDDLLFYNNILYKVTAPIAQGGTIAISGATTNVIQTDVDTELKNKIKLSSTAGLVKNDGTIDTNTYLTTHQDITGKVDKVASATNGNFAGLDSNGNLTDSGKSSNDFLPSNTPIPTVSVSYTGTASSTGVRKQQITVNNVAYDVDGSAYMEQEVILSTSGTTTVTFTNAIITDGKTLTLETSIWDLVPDDMVTTEGVCTITLPKWSSAVTIGVRLRVR